MVTDFLWYTKLVIGASSIFVISIIDKFLIAKNKKCRIVLLIIFLLIYLYVSWCIDL